MATAGSNRSIKLNGRFTFNDNHPEYGHIDFIADVQAHGELKLTFSPDAGQGVPPSTTFDETFTTS